MATIGKAWMGANGGEHGRSSAAPRGVNWEEMPPRPRPQIFFPFFWFPHTVNDNVVRVVSFFACVITIVSIIFHQEKFARWMMMGLAIDYLIRMCGGAMISPLGSAAACLTVIFPENLKAGPQKQFASFCGLCFSTPAAVFFLANMPGPGIFFAGILVFASGLEWLSGFCLGCFVFSYMIRFGIVPPTVNDLHSGQRALVENQLQHADDFSVWHLLAGRLAKPKVYPHQQPGQPETAADLRIKFQKTDDHKRKDFNPVKHVQIGDAMMPLGIGALGLAWKLAYYTRGIDKKDRMVSTQTPWQVLVIMSAVFLLLQFLLLLVKQVMYPRKIYKEIVHPMKSNFLAAWPMCLCIYAFALYDAPDQSQSDTIKHLCLVLFWIGAVLLKLIMVWRLAWLIGNRNDEQHTQAGLLLPVAGCCMAAMVWPIFDGFSEFTSNREVGWFFFGLSAVLSVVMLGGTILEGIKYHWSDERTRPAMGMWVVVLLLPFLAYVALLENPRAFAHIHAGVIVDPIAQTLYFAGLSIFLVLLWLAVPMGFLIKLKFDFSFWALAFPLDILAAATVVFAKASRVVGHHVIRHDNNNIVTRLAYATLALASYANLELLLSTLFWLLKRRWLRPDYKWAPLSLNKLTHEAFRAAGQKMLLHAQAIKGDQGSSSLQLAKRLACDWLEYAVVLEWHAIQEDQIMFREIDAFNPMCTREGYKQHEELGKREHSMNAAAEAIYYASSWDEGVGRACTDLVREMEAYVPIMDKHMDWEEKNLLVMNRRTFNMEIQCRIVRKIWEAFECKSVEECRGGAGPGAPSGSGWGEYNLAEFKKRGRYAYPEPDSEEKLFSFPPEFPKGEMPLTKKQMMRIVMPWVIRNLPEPMLRTRFARCWCWALPERAQHIGEMIYRGVSDSDFVALGQDVPEIIPRGLNGWVRRV